MKRSIHLITLLALLGLMLPASVLAQGPDDCDFEHIVQTGDWLSKIAEEYLGDPLAYPAIVAAANALGDDIYTDIDDPAKIEPGWVLCISENYLAPEGLSPEELANATYVSEWTQSGSATLVDGEYREPAAPGSATETVVMLTDHIAYGQLNGQPAAVAVLVTDPGGSGTFYDLAVLVNQGGEPVNVATTSLGDRVQINAVGIYENEIVVDMVQAGPDDPMCCPSQHVVQRYALEGDKIVQLSSEAVETIVDKGGLTPDQVSFDPQGLAEFVEGLVVPAMPYNDSAPTESAGHPDHLVFLFDDEVRLAIYPVAEYRAIWDGGENSQVSDQVDRLGALLAERETTPTPPMPILPPSPAVNDLATQFDYLDFANGSGVRYVGRAAQEAGPVTNDGLSYYFQGITSDGQFYVSFVFPMWTFSLPDSSDDVPAEALAQIENDYDAYLQQATDALNGLSDSELDWLPPLSMLDALVGSIAIDQTR
jgi:LysM repeat protein